jgi:AhpD family alkylhydroperoxidase
MSAVSARMKNPGQVLPATVPPIHTLVKECQKGGVPQETLELVHLRTSQLNGCSYCIELDARRVAKAGVGGEELLKLFAVGAWRESPHFSEAERAALALAECVTRLSDRSDPVPDEVWDEAAKHYDEKGLASLVLWIGTVNLFNRVNVTTRQPAGEALPPELA